MGRQSAAHAGPTFPQLSAKQSKGPCTLGHNMFTVPGVLTVQEAQRFIQAAESMGFKHQSSKGPAYGEAYRDNDRISFQDEQLAAHLWQQTGLNHIFEEMGPVEGMHAVGLNPNIRMYRYTPGQSFGKHIDESNDVAPGLVTLYTLLIYLSGPDSQGASSSNTSSSGQSSAKAAGAQKGRAGSKASSQPARSAGGGICTDAVQLLIGGETIFYGNHGKVLARIAPQPGLALLHLHGEDRCLEHEAAPVRQGCKYVLRSDVVFRQAAS